MPHTFPTRRTRANEVVDPQKITEEVQSVATKLNGRLGEHDLDGADLKAKLAVADGAYYGAHQAVKVSSPHWRRGGGHYYAYPTGDPDPSLDPVAEVADSEGWQALQDTGGTDTVQVNITAGDEDGLFILALAQWCAWSYDSSTPPVLDEDVIAPATSPLRLQFGVRLDGSVIDETITGAALYPDPPPQQWYRATRSSAAASDYDFRKQDYIQNTTGMPMAVHACRLTTCAKVIAGSHTVELVARRLPPADYKIDNDKKGTGVKVFNRRLLVLRQKGRAAHSGSAANVNVDAVKDGDVLTHTYFTTDTFTQFQTAVNALKDEHLSRGALRHEHLPSMLYGVKFTTAPDNVKRAHTGRYPGFGTDGAALSVAGDGGGNLLTLSGPTAGEWDLEANPGVMIILADVQVTDLEWTGGGGSIPASPDEIKAIGCLSIGVTNSAGTRVIYQSSEVYLNSSATDNTTNPRTPVEVNASIPLMLVIDSDDISVANQHITTIEVLCSTWDGWSGASPTNVTMKTKYGSLLVYVLKGVHLA